MPPRIDETRHPFEIGPWAELARNDPQAYRERQATEILLHAVGSSPAYGDRLYLKGGILMGLAYQSPRQTADIDFTGDFEPTEAIAEDLRTALNPGLQRAATLLGYPDLVCQVQRVSKNRERTDSRPRLFQQSR
jgi:hypothetical protein